ncbi:MAG: DUF6702 family protein [Saprospiraceae bacterium]
MSKNRLLLPLGYADTHEFHVSRTRIAYAAADQEWQISLYIFIDDLEKALSHATSGEPRRLGTDKETAEADSLILRYLQRRLILQADGDKLPLQWLGKEGSEDLAAFWIYLYIPDEQPAATFTITNKILTEVFDDQQNIVQWSPKPTVSRNILFHSGHSQEVVTF